MRSIVKMLGLAFFATLAFSAVGAIGAGSASALLFLTSGASEETSTTVNLNTETSPATLEAENGLSVKCPSVLGSGTILNKTDRIDKLLFTFHKCTAGILGACTSSGEQTGLIKTLELDALLITLLNGHYGLLILAEKGNQAEFVCGGVTIEVKGTVAGEFTATAAEAEAGATEMNLVFKKGAKAGESAIKDYWTLEGVREAKMESKGLGSTFEESNEQANGDAKTANIVKFCHK